MKAVVTGTTGFVGANLVRELLKDGAAVRVLVRPGSSRTTIEGLDVEEIVGDLEDRDSLRRALKGRQVLYRVAGASDISYAFRETMKRAISRRGSAWRLNEAMASSASWTSRWASPLALSNPTRAG